MIDLYKHSIPVEQKKPKSIAEYSSDTFRTTKQPEKVEKKEVAKPAPKKAPAKKAAPKKVVEEVKGDEA